MIASLQMTLDAGAAKPRRHSLFTVCYDAATGLTLFTPFPGWMERGSPGHPCRFDREPTSTVSAAALYVASGSEAGSTRMPWTQ